MDYTKYVVSEEKGIGREGGCERRWESDRDRTPMWRRRRRKVRE